MLQNQRRVVIENITLQINQGNIFIKRVTNELVNITSDVLVDGHDKIQASVLFKYEKERS